MRVTFAVFDPRRQLLTHLDRGGTSGAVVAARLAENLNVSVLVIEAGQHNDLLENTRMVGGWYMTMNSTPMLLCLC